MKHTNDNTPFQKKIKVDRRLSAVRRQNGLIREYTKALGGKHRLNIGEAEAIRRIASLTILVERQESLQVAFSEKYDADLHVRTTSAIKRIVDDLDLPKRSRRHSGNGGAPEIGEIPGETLEEYLARPEVIRSAERPIPAARIGAARRKRLRL